MKDIRRKDNESPFVTAKLNWKYHHLGIPTKKKMPDEEYLPRFKFYVSGFSNSPFGIEWMRFEDNCPISEILKTIPHIAFEVEDLDKELDENDFEIIGKPESPSEGVRTVMIMHNGAPIELIEFEKK
jgi:hypothetical protein